LIETSTRSGQNKELVEMSEKKPIKVIKKSERTRKQKPAPKANTTAQTAREMVQTVTNWVNELQQKRRTETANAIKLMLPENPRTSEA
jgi:2,3-bisphosphoglycerate-independent phosphoglycerate mutase